MAPRRWISCRKITNNNAKGEYYLTDIVEICAREGGRAAAVEAPAETVAGCNNRAELAELEADLAAPASATN